MGCFRQTGASLESVPHAPEQNGPGRPKSPAIPGAENGIQRQELTRRARAASEATFKTLESNRKPLTIGAAISEDATTCRDPGELCDAGPRQRPTAARLDPLLRQPAPGIGRSSPSPLHPQLPLPIFLSMTCPLNICRSCALTRSALNSTHTTIPMIALSMWNCVLTCKASNGLRPIAL